VTVYRRPDPIPLRRAETGTNGASLQAVRHDADDLNRLVAREIFQAILADRFPVGSVLPNEHQLAEDLRVSRTALREAIKGLVAKGVLETRRKRGTQVLERQHWNLLDSDLITWSRREETMRVSEELWELLVEIAAVCAAQAAILARPPAVGPALLDEAAPAVDRRLAFARLLLELARAGRNRFMTSILETALRNLLTDDPVFLDHRLARLEAAALPPLLSSIAKRDADGAREQIARALGSRLPAAGAIA